MTGLRLVMAWNYAGTIIIGGVLAIILVRVDGRVPAWSVCTSLSLSLFLAASYPAAACIPATDPRPIRQ